MPQMSPMNWLNLFFIFTIIFIMFSIMNYYMFFPSMPKSIMTKKYKMTSMNWKW
uniref:ATP synthase complex subunit 8 n=1 Tax=Rhinoestrus usbekistanicus TaxID=204923 RepID=A0A6C0PSC7_9MUSC|nr:ATP synthase F0 subunit 8 [Rhinoestrus usbekistanicus]QHX99790.1 ATP synthase F0 subunit 8 [Rhinoestrus usbekistanicus]